MVATLGAEQGEKLNAVLGRAPALVMETIERLGIDCQLRREGTCTCRTTPAAWPICNAVTRSGRAAVLRWSC